MQPVWLTKVNPKKSILSKTNKKSWTMAKKVIDNKIKIAILNLCLGLKNKKLEVENLLFRTQ